MKLRIELDSYSVVLYDDIEDYMFQICDTDTKYKLVDFTLDMLGIGPQILQCHSLLGLSYQRLAKDSLCIDNRIYEIYERVVTSPHLSNFAVPLSSLIEKDLAVSQISKFEFSRNYLSRLTEVYPQSPVIQYTLFVVELIRSKSPYYQAIYSQTELDQPFKAMLKANQHKAALWISYIEIEALLNLEQAFEKIETLSSKVIKSFTVQDPSEVKFIQVSIMDMYFRLQPSISSHRLKELVTVVNLAIQVVQALGIQVSSYAPELIDIKTNDSDDLFAFLSRHATSFLSMSKLSDKLLNSVIQLTAQKPMDNIIDASFINKKTGYRVTDFTVLVAVQSFFSMMAGTFEPEAVSQWLQDWQEIHQTKIRQLSNVYVKQYRSDLLVNEIKSTALIVNNMMAFIGRTVPQRYQRLSTLNSKLYRDVLQMDASIFDLMVADSIKHSYRFQLITDLKRLGVEFSFAEVAAIVFQLQRVDPVGTENLQEYLLNLHSDKTLSKQLLQDLKVSLQAPESQKPSWTWFSQGISIVLQNNALLSLQETMISRIVNRPSASTTSAILGSLHKAPFNKEFYLNYLAQDGQVADKAKIYSTMLEKEIRTVYDPL